MFIRSLLTTLSQFFDKIIPNSKIIVKGIRDPDDNFIDELLSINGLSHSSLKLPPSPTKNRIFFLNEKENKTKNFKHFVHT